MNIVLTAGFKLGLFTNGLNQNIVFLAELFEDLGHNVFLLLNQKRSDLKDSPDHLRMVLDKELDQLPPIDMLLQAGWCLPAGGVDKLKKRNPSLRHVHIHYGNRILADIERCGWNDSVSLPPHEVDEIWTSPHYEFSVEYFKIYYNNPKVFILPYIWAPTYMDIHEKIWNKGGFTSQYDPSAPKRLGILEPNLNLTKNCLPSIYICESAFRADPSSFERLRVYCSAKFTSKKYFRSLMWNLDLQKEGKIEYLPRVKVSKIFSQQSNVIVSHQLLNALNYTYLEALYYNIPLVHNSEFIKEAGYYYRDYSLEQGSAQLRYALTHHDSRLDEYKSSAKEVLWRYSPENPEVKRSYTELLK